MHPDRLIRACDRFPSNPIGEIMAYCRPYGIRAMKYFLLIVFAALTCSTARAENCMTYPPGPERFACASATHPGLADKRERCKQEAEGMGLHPAHNMDGLSFRNYVMACMRRGR